MKKILLIICIFVLTFALTGCVVKDEIFAGGGLTVKLTSEFKEYDSDKWDLYLENNDKVAFMSIRYNKQSKFGEVELKNYSLKEYMNLTLTLNGIDATTYVVEGPNGTFYYCYYTVGTDYGYMMVTMENSNYFYTINLSAPYGSFQESKPLLFQYASTIKIQ